MMHDPEAGPLKRKNRHPFPDDGGIMPEIINKQTIVNEYSRYSKVKM